MKGFVGPIRVTTRLKLCNAFKLKRSALMGDFLCCHNDIFRIPNTVCCLSESDLSESESFSLSTSIEPSIPKKVAPTTALFQTWRRPLWMSPSGLLHMSARSRANGWPEMRAEFRENTDTFIRFFCLSIVLSMLSAVHMLYHKLDRVTRDLSQFGFPGTGCSISYSRIVKCNPFTGIRLKDVRISTSSPMQAVYASHAEASLSGFFALLLRRRALLLNVRVEKAMVSVPCRVIDSPRREECCSSVDDIWSMLLSDTHSAVDEFNNICRMVKLGSFFIRHSTLLLKHTQLDDANQSDQDLEFVNVSGHLNLGSFVSESTSQSNARNARGKLASAKAYLRSGGSLQICLKAAEVLTSHAFPITGKIFWSRVRIAPVISFLHLPLQVTNGISSGNISGRSFSGSNPYRVETGYAKIDSVEFRTNPSPETPQLREVCAQLTFEEHRVVVDQLRGYLGTIPLEGKGDFDYRAGLNIKSQTNAIDVSTIVETFRLYDLIPVQGTVLGEAYLSGCFRDPFVNGRIKSVGKRAMVDKVPLKAAELSYEWDVAAGNLVFPALRAVIVGGGEVAGSGGLYFDMTQARSKTEYKQHHVRNPKGNFRPKSLPKAGEFEIDGWAPFRPYDSIQFNFRADGIEATDLLRWYRRGSGFTGFERIGKLSGVCDLSGHKKDANCRIMWQTASSVSESIVLDTDPGEERRTTSPSEFRKRSRVGAEPQAISSPSEDALVDEPFCTQRWNCEERSSSYLGPPIMTSISRSPKAGDTGGFLIIKLGDLPEARRVKGRMIVYDSDLCSSFLGHPYITMARNSTSAAIFSVDALFKGTICMRPSWERSLPSNAKVTKLDLVGLDGALAVRNLKLNGVSFNDILSGSLSVSTSDFSVYLAQTSVHDKTMNKTLADQGPNVHRSYSSSSCESQEKVDISMSTNGSWNISLRWGCSQISGSIVVDESSKYTAKIDVKGLMLSQLLNTTVRRGNEEGFSGSMDSSITCNMTKETGRITLHAMNLDIGPVQLDEIKAEAEWSKGDFILQNATLAQRRSEYVLNAEYKPSRGYSSESAWIANINIDRAYARDFAELLHGFNNLLSSLSSQMAFEGVNIFESFHEPSWIHRIFNIKANKRDDVPSWEVPCDLPFSEQLKWYESSFRKRPVLGNHATSRNRSCTHARFCAEPSNLGGVFSARLSFRSVPFRDMEPRNAHSETLSIANGFNLLKGAAISFSFIGQDLSVDARRSVFEHVSAAGFFEDECLSVGPVQLKQKDGTRVDSMCRVTKSGALSGSFYLSHAQIGQLHMFRQAPINAKGAVHGKLELAGTVSNPMAKGQLRSWNATIDENVVSPARADLSCSNGRCAMNIDARIQQKANHIATQQTEPRPSRKPRQTTSDLRRSSLFPGQISNQESCEFFDSVTIRVSVPVQLCFPAMISEKSDDEDFFQSPYTSGKWFSHDDDWLYVSVDVRKYGTLLLKAFAPEAEWTSGSSDIMLRVTGTTKHPEITGFVSINNGSLQLPWLSSPMHSLQGEIHITKRGAIVCRSLSGRCNQHSFSGSGSTLITSRVGSMLEERIQPGKKTDRNLDSKMSTSGQRREPGESRTADSCNEHDGIRLEFQGVPLKMQNYISSNISGNIVLKRSIMEPEISGSLILSDGDISVNPLLHEAERPSASLTSRSSQGVKILGSLLNVQRVPRSKSHRTCDGNILSRDRLERQRCAALFQGLRVTLGRNVRISHSWLFNILVRGHATISGTAIQPFALGRIDLVDGSVNALPTRWTIRRSERSYIKFSKTSDGRQDPIIRLSLESDAVLLRISECHLSSWSHHIALSDKTNIGDGLGRWGHGVQHFTVSRGGIRKRISRLLSSYLVNTRILGGELGRFHWRIFPTYHIDAHSYPSRSSSGKFGAGWSIICGDIWAEMHVFVDKLRGGKLILQVPQALSIRLFGDNLRRTVQFTISLPFQ